MRLQVLRFYRSRSATIGHLVIDGEFRGLYTLEDAVREVKIPGKTAIPVGCYDVVLDYSQRFKRVLPHIMGVPNFKGVRIHPGNTVEDTEGCILVGLKWHESAETVSQSRDAFGQLMEQLERAHEAGEEIKLEIS